MLLGCAPRAMQIPISLVRSVARLATIPRRFRSLQETQPQDGDFDKSAAQMRNRRYVSAVSSSIIAIKLSAKSGRSGDRLAHGFLHEPGDRPSSRERTTPLPGSWVQRAHKSKRIHSPIEKFPSALEILHDTDHFSPPSDHRPNRRRSASQSRIPPARAHAPSIDPQQLRLAPSRPPVSSLVASLDQRTKDLEPARACREIPSQRHVPSRKAPACPLLDMDPCGVLPTVIPQGSGTAHPEGREAPREPGARGLDLSRFFRPLKWS